MGNGWESGTYCYLERADRWMHLSNRNRPYQGQARGSRTTSKTSRHHCFRGTLHPNLLCLYSSSSIAASWIVQESGKRRPPGAYFVDNVNHHDPKKTVVGTVRSWVYRDSLTRYLSRARMTVSNIDSAR